MLKIVNTYNIVLHSQDISKLLEVDCMKVQLRGRNLQVPDNVKDYTEKRLSKLDRLIEKEVEAVVTLIEEPRKNYKRVEITIPIGGYVLRGEEEDVDFLSAIDLATDKMEKQLVRSKERFSRKGRLSITKLPSMAGIAPATEEEDTLNVRTKRFPAKPMTLDEAIMRMDMVGHAFFAFRNAETGTINVVYRRNDGNYGLLEPEE